MYRDMEESLIGPADNSLEGQPKRILRKRLGQEIFPVKFWVDLCLYFFIAIEDVPDQPIRTSLFLLFVSNVYIKLTVISVW